ncbi:hypothetical protein HRbin41_01287 [bacterium HR41]|nr:hypothetical protein HRbin41_01287 [bacterium HR41]
MQQQVGAERARRDHHAAGAQDRPLFAQPRTRADAFDLEAVGAVAATERPDVDDGALRPHVDAESLGEPQVVLDQGVLGADRTADHAPPAARAARAGGSRPAEVGVGNGDPGRSEKHAHRRLAVGVFAADLARELAQQLVGAVVAGPLGDAEHPLRLGVVGCEHTLPVGEIAPLGVFEEPPRRHVEGVGVPERTAADSRAAYHRHILEQRETKDPATAEFREPPVATHVPGRAGEVVVAEAASRLEHADPVALFG